MKFQVIALILLVAFIGVNCSNDTVSITNNETIKLPPKHQNLTFAPGNEHKKGPRPCDKDCFEVCDDDCLEQLFHEIAQSTYPSCKIISPIITFEKYLWCYKINDVEYCGHQPVPSNATSQSSGNRRRYLNAQQQQPQTLELEEDDYYPKPCTGTSDTTTCIDSHDQYNTFSCQAKPTYAPQNAPAFICMNVHAHPPTPVEEELEELAYDFFYGEEEEEEGEEGNSDNGNEHEHEHDIEHKIEEFEDDFDPSEEEMGEWFFEISYDCEEHIYNNTQSQNIKQFLNCTGECIEELWSEYEGDGENNSSSILKLSLAFAFVLVAIIV